MFLIGDHNYHLFTNIVTVNGNPVRYGLVPRNYNTHPVGSLRGIKPFSAVSMPLVPRSEWSERCKDQAKYHSSLSHIRKTGNNGSTMVVLDQNGQGFCWAYSSTMAVMMVRATMGMPYVRLSAHSVACVIKSFRDEGGWGAASAEFIAERGVAPVSAWPEKSMSRSNNTAATWAEAARYKLAEAWVETDAPAYDRTLTFDQFASGLLLNNAGVGDFNWWGHSVCLLSLVDGRQHRDTTRAPSGKLATLPEYELMWGFGTAADGYGIDIANSWTASWGEDGCGVLTGSKAVPDGGLLVRSAIAA